MERETFDVKIEEMKKTYEHCLSVISQIEKLDNEQIQTELNALEITKNEMIEKLEDVVCHAKSDLSSELADIQLDRYPKMFEKITVGTLPYSFRASVGLRNAFICDESGNYIVKANCPWVYINTDTGRPVRPDEMQLEAYGLEERIPMDYAPRKISLPENMEDCEPIRVLPHFIDTNHHVNNAQYVELAHGIADESRQVNELRVEYKKQAHLGDILYPKIGSKNDWEYVTFQDENENTYASVALHM